MGLVPLSHSRRLMLAVAIGALLAGSPRAETTQYTYDALGRLVSAIDQNGKTVVYTYDNAGNRTRLSNGQEYAELFPTAFTASSNAGATGLSVAGAMRDSGFTALASIHATQSESGAWIQADLGAAKNVNHIQVAPAVAASVGAGVEDANGLNVEYSVDGTTWKSAATINGMAAGVTRSIALGGVSLRYLRLKRPGTGQVSLGDLRLFSSASLGSPLIAEPDTVSTNGASSITFDPRTNDRAFDGHAFTISAAENPPHGQAIVNSGTSLTYIPNTGYVGGDTFRYTIADGDSGVASAQIFVNVTPLASANRSPTAVDDTFMVADRASGSVDGVTVLRPTLNDRDPDYDVLTVSSTTTPWHGTATITGGSLIEYVPATSYSGADSFSYTISDGRGGTATANIALTIANAAPIAVTDFITTDRNTTVIFDPRVNDSDPNGDSLTISSLTPPQHGSAAVRPDGKVSYAPTAFYVGSDNFAYTISDGRGATATASVIATVSPPRFSTLEVMQDNLYGPLATLQGGSFSSATNGVHVYLDQPLTAGRSYWEVKLLCGAIDPGVANVVNLARNFGGYSNKNAGIDTYFNQTWTTSASGSGLSAAALNDVYGFALDADARTLKILKNNASG
ncbi:Ig-like domain-containing protein, partial [Phenylobacterium sp.]|uniref:Ig-like domain-containing protein n=1 Tax=Phenylobacterium sp. TaxID=1871053 RepID=UPI0030F40590